VTFKSSIAVGETEQRQLRDIGGAPERSENLRSAGRHCGSEEQDGDDDLRLSYDPRL